MAGTEPLVSKVVDDFWKSYMLAGTAQQEAMSVDLSSPDPAPLEHCTGMISEEASGRRTSRRARADCRTATKRTRGVAGRVRVRKSGIRTVTGMPGGNTRTGRCPIQRA